MATGKDQSGFEKGFIVGSWMTGASVIKTVQLTGVSVGTVT